MDIDYIAEHGVGAWIRQRREKLGLSRLAVAQAATVSDKTIERYEKDTSLSYETLRVLDALGVKWSAGPLRDAPGAVNRELRELRLAVEAHVEAERVAREDFDRRLRSLEAKVGKSATEADLKRALAVMLEAILTQASRGTATGEAGN